MSDSESDIELKSSLPIKSVHKTPKSPQEHLKKEPKKLTTKDMVHSALNELKSRKGVSLHAIKKYMVEKYNVDTEKINFYIKKSIKLGLESGTIIQTRGTGVSGSFKLAPPKKEEKKLKKKPKKPMKKSSETTKAEKPDKTKKETGKTKITKKPAKKEGANSKNEKEKSMKQTKKEMTKKDGARKEVKIAKESKKEPKSKEAKSMKTPSKKKSLVKRKSIGSIIKPPKMKPKMRD